MIILAVGGVADPRHFNADPDPTFHFIAGAGPDPASKN
jgi:hypothetical protein